MKKVYLLAILFTIIFQSCIDDDCGECFTPPQSFHFEIIDQASGENLFTNNTFESDDIEIINSLNNETIEFSFISENELNIIQVNSIGWETEIVNLEVSIAENELFNFYVDAERKLADCCSYTDYNEITITNAEFELDNETGVYKILID